MRRAFLYILLSMLLTLAALYLIYNNVIDSKRAHEQSQAVANTLTALLAAAETVPPEAVALSLPADALPAAPTGTDVPTGADAPAAAAAPEAGVLWADGAAYLGVLSIPALDIALPIRYDYDYAALQYTPVRYAGSCEGDDLVLVAHNYDSHFGRIHTLRVGDAVTLADAAGATHRYTVAKVETLEPWQVTEMLESGYALTLYTCTLGGQHRVTVRCARAS